MRIAQQLEPSTSRFIAAEGRVLFAARRYSEAEMMIKRAIELEPGNKNSWDQLASIYLAQGRVDDSVAAFQRSLPDEVAKKVRRPAVRRTGQARGDSRQRDPLICSVAISSAEGLAPSAPCAFARPSSRTVA